MNGNRDDLLRFCRTYVYFMAREIGIRGELNMEPDSDYAMSIKTSDGNFTPIIGEVSVSRDLNAPATALQRGRNRMNRELSSYVLVFLMTKGDSIYIDIWDFRGTTENKLTDESLDCMADRNIVQVFLGSAFCDYGIADIHP